MKNSCKKAFSASAQQKWPERCYLTPRRLRLKTRSLKMKLESTDLELMIAAAANRVQEHTAVNYKKKCSVDGDD